MSSRIGDEKRSTFFPKEALHRLCEKSDVRLYFFAGKGVWSATVSPPGTMTVPKAALPFCRVPLAQNRTGKPSTSYNKTGYKKYYVKSAETQAGEGLQNLFLHPRLILPEFPAVTAPPDALTKIRHGASVNLPYFERGPQLRSPVLIRVFADQTHLVAIARQVAGTLFHPKVVLI